MLRLPLESAWRYRSTSCCSSGVRSPGSFPVIRYSIDTERKFAISSHKLRHNFATNYCIDQYRTHGQVDIYRLMYLMGHEDIETTRRYLHMANEILASQGCISHLDGILNGEIWFFQTAPFFCAKKLQNTHKYKSQDFSMHRQGLEPWTPWLREKVSRPVFVPQLHPDPLRPGPLLVCLWHSFCLISWYFLSNFDDFPDMVCYNSFAVDSFQQEGGDWFELSTRFRCFHRSKCNVSLHMQVAGWKW